MEEEFVSEGRIEETRKDIFTWGGDYDHVDVKLLIEILKFLHFMG